MRFVALALIAACGGTAEPGSGEPPFEVTDPTDADEDGIPEQLEDHLMTVFGPELRLAPDDIDWTRPANVDWYLPKVHMRFDHGGCPDDNAIELGQVTLDNIATQQHYTKASGTGLCRHNDGTADLRFSNKKHLEFFLQPTDDDAVHPGIPPARSAEWRAYTQVRPSTYVRADGKAAAYDLQVWYFFPYNDFVALANHEADWEHITISIAADRTFVSAFFASHNIGHRFDDPAELEWIGDTHVVGYVSDGSHATYHSAGAHPTGFPNVDDHTYANGPAWQTWTNFKNLGQVGKVLNDQRWASYGGRWGEVGNTDDTSGPPGPMFNGKWDITNEYPQ
ncbi:MAG: Vps62-related protein [Deltaproteobacteria bacterium]|nr:Vps62-related protein [Deltaproteobacteria bacterium]